MQRQLDADVVQPAEADRKAAEEVARGEASRIVEQGKAQAASLHALVEQYKKAGGAAREVLVLQKLLPFVEAVSGAQQKLLVRKLTVLPAASGADGDWTRKAIATSEQLKAATGIDLGAMARRMGAAPPPQGPPKPA